MQKGSYKAFVQIVYAKGSKEDHLLHPSCLDKTFMECEVATDATLNLVELKGKFKQYDCEEGGEDENEEMEEE